MATENRFRGAERIRGELCKVGLQVAKRTIQKYVRQVRPRQGPSQNWSTFLNHHAKNVWACDFLPIIDLFFRPIHACFIVELASRRIVHFGVTQHSTDAWVAQQLREATPFGQAPRFLIRDRDSKYGESFTRVAAGTPIEVVKAPYRAPKANAICERFLGRVRRECLDHILILGERHLYRVVKQYAAYFNQGRPHRGIEQRNPEGPIWVTEEGRRRRVIAIPVLNGLHHDYRRVA